MSNVTELRPASEAELEKTLAEAKELLAATMQSIRDNDLKVDACHRICIDKINELVDPLCDGYCYQAVGRALSAQGLVALARLALKTGPAFFDKEPRADLGAAIAEALEAALDHLEREDDPGELDPDDGERKAA